MGPAAGTDVRQVVPAHVRRGAGARRRLLLEEYKLRHERLSDIELQPIAPPGRGRGAAARGARPRPRGIPRAYARGSWCCGLAAIYLLGKAGGQRHVEAAPGPSTEAAPATNGKKKRQEEEGRAPLRAAADLRDGARSTCVWRRRGTTLVNGATLGAGSRTNAYRSSRFDLTLGNGNARMKVNGKLLDVPDVQSGIGYRITVTGRHSLSPSARPTCA